MDDKAMTRRPPRNAKALQRVSDAWAMRIRGATWDEVAAAVGYANAPNAVRAVRNFVGTLPEPSMPELRSLWRERLEYLWPLAARDVEEGRPGAVRAAVAIADRAAKLDGLDAPTRVEVAASVQELQQIAAELIAQERQGIEADIFDVEIVGE